MDRTVMSRKRTRRLKLVLLGSAGPMASGCGDRHEVVAPVDDHSGPRPDEVAERRGVGAGAAGTVSDGYLQAAAMLASGRGAGVAAPLDLARLAYTTDQAAETFDVASNNAQIPHSSGTTSH